MKLKLNIDKLLAAGEAPSKWYLDNVVYNDRTTNPETLKSLLKRIRYLQSLSSSVGKEEKEELKFLIEIANELDEKECMHLLSNDDELSQHLYIENLSRRSALEVLCNNKISIETMQEMCKLSPQDFILASKRSQDLINSIQELILQGETLSRDVAGA